jgi:hypothetical protein
MVRAHWVPLSGAKPQRALLRIVDLTTGRILFNRTPAELERQLGSDPAAMLKLCVAISGIAVTIFSLAKSHERATRHRADLLRAMLNKPPNSAIQ